jgi:hypothetical protein
MSRSVTRGWPGALAYSALAGLAVSCTSVSPEAVRAHRDSGVTRRYDRSVPDVYQASVAAIDRIRTDHPLFSGLEVVEKDPATGTVIAEQRLDSAVIPGLGEKDAVGIFVAEAPNGASDVTVVALASDQIPGSAGTYVASLNGAESRVFPAIDAALDTIPESAPPAAAAAPAASASPPRAQASVPAAPLEVGAATPGDASPARVARVSESAPPVAAAAARVAHRETLLDRVYDALHASSAWRPLVRETRADGSEEVRVGRFATITASDGRVRLVLRDGGGSAAEAARLALEIERAGFSVDVVSERAAGTPR